MTDVFISYSRRNLDFVHRLDAALSTHGKESWFDQKKEPLAGLPPSSKWWDEIKYGIETADNFLFIISPESIASPYCNAEVAHALQHEKRIVTVMYCDTASETDTLQAIDAAIDAIPGDSELPPSVSATITNLRSLTRRNWLEVSRVQYVMFSDGDSFTRSLETLIKGLDMDLAWIRMWSQIRQVARILAETKDESYRWSEARLRPVRETIQKRGQPLTEIERDFLQPEAERLLREIDNIDTPHTRRSVIGEQLAMIGDPRPGVGLRPDGLPDIVWCYIDVPSHLRGKKIEFMVKDEKWRDFEINPFYIAKYPITFIQFETFLRASDGFHSKDWWQGLEKEYDHRAIGVPHYEYSNHPRRNVQWYYAVVFCRWLNTKLPTQAWPDTSILEAFPGPQDIAKLEIRLPTEWEWQYAATSGNPANKYPWGEEEDDRRCNTAESGLRREVAVGMYPHGSTSVGVMDMLGNVWEWCLNEYIIPTNIEIDDGDSQRAQRGGSWNNIEPNAKYNHRSYVGSAPMIERTCRGHRLQRSKKFFAAWSKAFRVSNNSQWVTSRRN